MAEEKISLKLAMVSIPEQQKHVAYGIATENKTRTMRLNFGNFVAQLLVMAMIVGLSIGCYFVISRYFLQSVQVVGESMVPTLQPDAHYLLNRWAFHNRDPKVGDVVVLRDPADHGISVKRIVATAGQAVLFKDGKVFINGKEFAEPYLLPETHTYTYSQAKEQLITCGNDQFFVLGDNRLKSIDSRVYGSVPRANILGLVVLK
jgi:signal peptidase I